jgi:SAM-dependent methyltransferase
VTLAAALAGLARRALGPQARPSADRRLLEQRLLPALDADPTIERLLFVGCDRATREIPLRLRRTELWTLEPRRGRARYGSPRHIVDTLQHLGRHVPAATFDAVIVNGVLGWGLNRADAAELAFAACHRALTPGGLLVIGWNDLPPRNRVRLQDVTALERFAPVRYAGFAARVAVPGVERHVYEFFRARPV